MESLDLQHFVDVFPNTEASRQSYAKFIEEKSPAEVRWWSKDTVAVVTGANKGIGFEIVRQLAKEGVTTILTARDETRGLEAIDKLAAEGLKNVSFYPLDVTDPASASKLSNWLKEKFGGIDILINNAGIGSLQDDYETAKITLSTNYYGQKTVSSALFPLLKPSPAGARIVFVSSELGQLQYLNNEDAKHQLTDVDQLTEEAIDSLGSAYLENVKKGGSPWTTGFSKDYSVSKALLNAYSRVLAKSLSSLPAGRKIYVNSMSPGLTYTELNNYVAGRTVEHGADTAVWLALFPSGGPSGGFFRDRADCPL